MEEATLWAQIAIRPKEASILRPVPPQLFESLFFWKNRVHGLDHLDDCDAIGKAAPACYEA
jgi:hypothetical protein